VWVTQEAGGSSARRLSYLQEDYGRPFSLKKKKRKKNPFGNE
jgi:hypothetical protein